MSNDASQESCRRIVVIDDVPSARRVVRKMLEKIGYSDVVEAENGESALNLIKAKPTALIISDWNMPQVPGIELVRRVKGDPDLAAIPIIMITSDPDKDTVVEAYDAGVKDFIMKPFNFETLVQKVRAAFEPSSAEE